MTEGEPIDMLHTGEFDSPALWQKICPLFKCVNMIAMSASPGHGGRHVVFTSATVRHLELRFAFSEFPCSAH